MTQPEILKMLAETVAEYQNCILEVSMSETSAMAHLIPLIPWPEMGDDEDEEDN